MSELDESLSGDAVVCMMEITDVPRNDVKKICPDLSIGRSFIWICQSSAAASLYDAPAQQSERQIAPLELKKDHAGIVEFPSSHTDVV